MLSDKNVRPPMKEDGGRTFAFASLWDLSGGRMRDKNVPPTMWCFNAPWYLARRGDPCDRPIRGEYEIRPYGSKNG